MDEAPPRETPPRPRGYPLLPTPPPSNQNAPGLRRAPTGRRGPTPPLSVSLAPSARPSPRSSKSFAERLIAFACIEGIFFSGSFCSIYWLEERARCPAPRSATSLSRDEGLHDFACLLYSYLNNKPSAETVARSSARRWRSRRSSSATRFPSRFVAWPSPRGLRRVRRDHLLGQLGMEKEYNATNPSTGWSSSPPGQDQLREAVGEYQKSGVMNSPGRGAANAFSLDEDF